MIGFATEVLMRIDDGAVILTGWGAIIAVAIIMGVCFR